MFFLFGWLVWDFFLGGCFFVVFLAPSQTFGNTFEHFGVVEHGDIRYSELSFEGSRCLAFGCPWRCEGDLHLLVFSGSYLCLIFHQDPKVRSSAQQPHRHCKSSHLSRFLSQEKFCIF